MEVSEAKRLKDLESENSKLKKLLAEAHLDIDALKGVFGVKRYPHRSCVKWERMMCRSSGRTAVVGECRRCKATHRRRNRLILQPDFLPISWYGYRGQVSINENTNGLLCQYFLKGSDLSNFSQATLDAVACNSTPASQKAQLSFRYPAELFMPEFFNFFEHHLNLLHLELETALGVSQ